MIKVKTFTSQLKIFHIMQELQDIDELVNAFIAEQGISKVISASDALYAGADGETIGMSRLLVYEE